VLLLRSRRRSPGLEWAEEKLMGTKPRRYHPGELAPVSGIYRITHYAGHRDPHEAILIRGEEFPICRACHRNVSFEMTRNLSHATHDWDFAGVTGLTVALKPSYAEVRSSPRYEVAVPITVTIGHTGEVMELRGLTQDISVGGLSAALHSRIDDVKVPIRLNLPTALLRVSVSVEASLRHRRGLRHGFEFGALTERERDALRSLFPAAQT
jgi:PilZ domain